MKKTLLILFLSGFMQLSFGHSFHYEIQVSNALLLNQEKQLSALDITWLYDDEVSAAMLQDQKDLKKLGDKLIQDLDVLGYFTQIKINEKVLTTGEVKKYTLEKDKNGSLKLRFTLPIKKPVSLAGKTTISLNHEDPAAAAILYYDDVSNIILNAALKDTCRASVKEKGNFTEGEFPQIVQINCNG